MSHRFRRVLPRWHTTAREVEDELRFHLDKRTEELVARGLTPVDARRAAEREFGDLDAARSELTRIDQHAALRLRRTAWWTDLRGDLRFGIRLLLRSPGFTLAALTTLALAIGGNSAAFTLFHAVLIKRLPYADPERLVHIWEDNPRSARGYSEASWPDFSDWRSGSNSFTALEGYDQTNVTVAGSAGGQMLQGGRVTTGFFDLLGISPVLGRAFRTEDEVPGGADVAVLGFGFWQQRFGGSTGVLDSSLSMDGRTYRVIGVLPEQFRFAPLGEASIWLPLDPADPSRQRRSYHGLRVVGRLRDGVSAVEARASLDVVMAHLAEAYPESNQGRSARVIPLTEELTGPSRPLLMALLAAMTLVLAIAGANIAGLMLARALARGEEMMVRSSLGASRARLLRQLFVESLLLAGIGGLLGVGLARVGLHFLPAILPEGLRAQLPLVLTSAMDGTILVYSCLITLIMGIGFGLGPVLHVLRSHEGGAIGNARRSTVSRGMLRLRDGLIVAQIALTATLLAGSALLAQSIAALLHVDLGFQTQQVTTLRVALSGPRFSAGEAQQRFFEQLLEAVRAIPGVGSAGAVSHLPLDGGGTLTFRVDGEPEVPPSERREVVGRAVAGEYFQTLQVPVRSGRLLSQEDNGTGPHRVLIDASTAREFFETGEPVGRQIRFYAFPAMTWEIAGVVGDIRTGPLDQPFRPTIYFTHLQNPQNRMSVVVRSGLDPTALTARIREAVNALDRDAVVYAERTLQAQVADSAPVEVRRLSLALLGLCAALALVLSVIGLYGVVAFTVARRDRELGIRAALGASPRALQQLVMRHGLGLTLAGGALGLVLSLVLAGSIGALLFGVSATDPITYVGTAGFLAAVTALASWIPARRATATDPAIVLRRE
jgi:putative ABC transport system permease protein